MSCSNLLLLTVALICTTFSCKAFLIPHPRQQHLAETKTSLSAGIGDAFGSIFKRIDDEMDDFFFKRMGKGEIFYGARKVNPTETGEYEGFGLSDYQKIEERKAQKAYWEEAREAIESSKNKKM
uniref:PS II complex 12 kDa extrinsic protein n=1 Tax=Corethron hystrix TaxID=216773 RepID=A0A7S1BFW7_9STRA|mmetsp:Transcript_23637/g.53945  ORF Transcript_23637/g.53945 Transcript_23637/m.53945 type:complete len:124 (+) Transcript_23637:55-426(+)|eukprot:CAMPEP_0113297058 /NCGR_PEP_ID=MMETSP0010_2-20120614/79_1 /TAXON_ID=216773 ORGANISM="Corethron hystrix, Strain 308" /NCGR_SAMPLE_ID=MMETSP0010_2 /ASSEMBLY_ACC=CAM_ASM_000155 /LENGTH=123 /DNA_ID=CAMNT_0000149885 /DNA_START=55 /DNA_END=426 /DNA_ORIENTATION=+ /assembly_acc=CAM_ASM_000155